MKHPEEDYWRLGVNIDDLDDTGIGFEERMKILKEERELLLQFEIEERESPNNY